MTELASPGQPAEANITSQPHLGREDEGPRRLDFHQLCNHGTKNRPGFYLMLLRTEIRHRSLREKPLLPPSE